ncbi:MAG TPA: ABC transporter ATP-binding protein [Candidatus Brocadiia bacterium]|nr:ABC transporter ATP-binding protein [Candidatus Brocadiia bacterium]
MVMQLKQDKPPLIKVENLCKFFPVRRGFFGAPAGYVHAVDCVSFTVGRGETVGLVGESGCGKTTAGRTLLRLLEPTAGRVLFRPKEDADPVDITAAQGEELRRLRRNLQIVFQDPIGSLNPRMTVREIVGEGLAAHSIGSRSEREDRIVDVLKLVGLVPEHRFRYPHEFSGGQRQRIGIARALILDPQFIVCDEPVSALDVSIQAQIISLLESLQEELGLAYLFIAHDLAVVEHISNRIAVMYLGKIVEMGPAEEVCRVPLHPYSRTLLESVPVPDPRRKVKAASLTGGVPTPIDPPPGCRFAGRCPLCLEECGQMTPPLREVHPGHWSACVRAEETEKVRAIPAY